jgi:thymidylate synthase
MFVRGIIHEILWYLQGNTNIKYLQDNNVTIWDEWADERGDLGPVYGAQWRRWKRFEPIGVDSANGVIYREADPVDQIAKVIQRLRTNPTDRRLVINAWNVGELDKMALPPCHAMFQFWSDGTNLSCHLYQRSCDVGLGVPFNIVQYSILTRMVAHVTGLQATEFVWTGGDVHIYNNHIEQLKEQLQRKPYPSPILRPFASSIKEIDDFKYEDFVIEGYTCHPTIKMEVAV